MFEAKHVIIIFPLFFLEKIFFKLSLTSNSLPDGFSLNTFVESQIIAVIPSLHISLISFSSIGGPTSGLGSIFQSPV